MLPEKQTQTQRQISRRDFLKILAAFVAFLSLGGFNSLFQGSAEDKPTYSGGYGGGNYGV